MQRLNSVLKSERQSYPWRKTLWYHYTNHVSLGYVGSGTFSTYFNFAFDTVSSVVFQVGVNSTAAPVCGPWTLNDSHVVCRQVGLGNAEGFDTYTLSSPTKTEAWVKRFKCKGNPLKCIHWVVAEFRHNKIVQWPLKLISTTKKAEVS